MSSIRVFLILLATLSAAPAFAQTPSAKPETAAVQTKKKVSLGSLAPLPVSPAPASSHAPFADGDCKICHQNSDPKQPGPLRKSGPALCLECHEEFAGVMKRAHTHEPARADCVSCHNPHNAASPKLLLKETRALCVSCHEKIGAGVTVEHKALNTGAQCGNCHNPHGSAVAKLLLQRPFELCLSCHNVDTLVDAKGKKLQNIKAWLDGNKVWHGPVRDKDCNGCHQPHGGNHFRLLEEDYPQEFYAKYDAKTYGLCFSCHNDDAFSQAQTTLTSFRDGNKNLHFVHLQQSGRGRTCRACHEVHAAKQKNFIRDGVPYGSSGWVLKLNYKASADGGSCEKTCHAEKSYVNNKAR